MTSGGEATHVEAAIREYIASGRVGTPEYLDYVHLVRTAAGWRIVNDLCSRRNP